MSITVCPNKDQYKFVSFTTSPVTQVAETAVNIASGKDVAVLLRDAIGSIRRTVPSKIRTRKLTIIT
jgi:hypothetical protein